MSATILCANVPGSLPVIELTINGPTSSQTHYPDTIEQALSHLDSLGINEIEYDELTDTRLLHPSLPLLAA